MKTIKIAFDIDGTLRCNCTDTCNDANASYVALANILGNKFKNIELHAWSGGGKDYTWNFVRTHNLGKVIPENRCWSKAAYETPKMDIAVDDQHEFKLGGINLIVRAK